MPNNPNSEDWLSREVDKSAFSDKRLGDRFYHILSQLNASIGKPIPMACQDWASTKATYRFLSNDAVSESEILSGHFQATKDRVSALEGPILVLQDTTEFVYKRAQPDKVGSIGVATVGRSMFGKLEQRTICGLLMHGSLAITPEGLPLGLCAVKFWTRSKFKSTNALKRQINPTRMPIEEKESFRWLENMRQASQCLGRPERLVHIGDRENDIYEFFCVAQEIGTHFVVRTCVNRLSGDEKQTISEEMEAVQVQGTHHVQINNSPQDIAHLDIKYKTIRVLPPIGKQKKYPPQTLTVIHAQEKEDPEDRPPIEWKLITNLPITSLQDAIEKLEWYAQRWKIETYHKILKSACRAEDILLRTTERIVNLIAIFCIMSWRIFWLTMINRTAPDIPAELVLSKIERDTLDKLKPDKWSNLQKPLSSYIMKIAQLGGYMARNSDPPPGNIIIWRGWNRLMDIIIGTEIIQNQTCG